MHDARALSIFCSASRFLLGGSSLIMFLRISATVLCILSHAALDCEFFTVVGGLLIPYRVRSSWKFQPVNSPPLSCMHLRGLGYLESQQFANCSAICSLVLSLICIASTMFETGSMHVRVLNSNSIQLILIFHGPIKSTATVSHGNSPAILGGNVCNFCNFVCSSDTCVGIN